MTTLAYDTLSKTERRAARKLANKLLRTVPAANQPAIPGTLRGALSTSYTKPENVIAALVYCDDDGNWWGDIVLRKGDGWIQMGTAARKPLRSRELALQALRQTIAVIKAMHEDPIVQRVRDIGLDPQQIGMLRVHHQAFGCRWVVFEENEIATMADYFAKFLQRDGAEHSQLIKAFNVDHREAARWMILDAAPGFATDPQLLLPPDDSEERKRAFDLLYHAAAYLLWRGIQNIDDRDNSCLEAAIIEAEGATHDGTYSPLGETPETTGESVSLQGSGIAAG